MSIDKPTVVLKRFYGNSLSEHYLRQRHFQSFLVAFNEQIQIAGKSKASFVEIVSCFATVKARIRNNQMCRTYQAKLISTEKTQRLREGRLVSVSFMLDISVLYKSCVAYLAKWTTLFAEFIYFD